MENQESNPLLCDIETGMCEMPSANSDDKSNANHSGTKPVKVIYFTDPICSTCWGIEPQLRKMKLQYGNILDIEYHMGGLLKDWSYNSGGISKPSDVAHHWDEVSAHYDMPIDGDVWLEDPLPSSYPPSIAFKAAQMQDEKKALAFLRAMREMVFLKKKNITRWEHLEVAAQEAGLDTTQLKKDYEGKAKELFNEDLELAKKFGVRGFPTLFFVDASGKQEKVYGSKPYEVFETAISKLMPFAMKLRYETDWKNLFSKHPTMTSREFAELSSIPRNEVEPLLEKLTQDDQLNRLKTKNGMLWAVKSR